jgi:hypothetical protein
MPREDELLKFPGVYSIAFGVDFLLRGKDGTQRPRLPLRAPLLRRSMLDFWPKRSYAGQLQMSVRRPRTAFKIRGSLGGFHESP